MALLPTLHLLHHRRRLWRRSSVQEPPTRKQSRKRSWAATGCTSQATKASGFVMVISMLRVHMFPVFVVRLMLFAFGAVIAVLVRRMARGVIDAPRLRVDCRVRLLSQLLGISCHLSDPTTGAMAKEGRTQVAARATANAVVTSGSGEAHGLQSRQRHRGMMRQSPAGDSKILRCN